MAFREDNEIRLVLLGKTGTGKSSLGNNLIGRKKFASEATGSSLTKKCYVGERQLEDGEILVVVDTPGLFDTDKSNQETFVEICRCIGLSSPGPHAFLLVIRIGRFTPEESKAIELLRAQFGEKVMKFVVVVFTEKDSLDYDGKILEDFISTAPQSLRDVINVCGSRYVGVNNRSTDTSEGLSTVIGMVRRTISGNGGGHYTDEMYQAAERVLQQERAEMEEENNRKREEINRQWAELKKKEEELNQREYRLLNELEHEINVLREFNSRQAVRQKVEKKPGFFTKILSAFSPRCSIL